MKATCLFSIVAIPSLFFGFIAAWASTPTAFKWVENTLPIHDHWSTDQIVSPVFCFDERRGYLAREMRNWQLELKRSFSFWPATYDLGATTTFELIPKEDHQFYKKNAFKIKKSDICYRAEFQVPYNVLASDRYILRLVVKRGWWWFLNDYFPWSPKFSIVIGTGEAFLRGIEKHVKPAVLDCLKLVRTEDLGTSCRRFVDEKCIPNFNKMVLFIEELCDGAYEFCAPHVKHMIDGMVDQCSVDKRTFGELSGRDAGSEMHRSSSNGAGQASIYDESQSHERIAGYKKAYQDKKTGLNNVINIEDEPLISRRIAPRPLRNRENRASSSPLQQVETYDEVYEQRRREFLRSSQKPNPLRDAAESLLEETQ